MMKRLYFLVFLSAVPVLWSQDTTGTADLLQQIQLLRDQEKYEEAIPYFKRLLEIDAKISLDSTRIEHVINTAENFMDTEQYTEAHRVLEGVLNTVSANPNPTLDALSARIWMWNALVYANEEIFDAALNNYEHAAELFEKYQVNANELAFCYKNMAQIFMRYKNLEGADTYLNKALEKDIEGNYKLSILNQLSNNAFWNGDYVQAERYFKAGEGVKGRASGYANRQQIGAQIYHALGNLPLAERLNEQALNWFEEANYDFNNILTCYTLRSLIWYQSGKKEECAQNFKDTEKRAVTKYKGKSRELAKFYLQWGDLYLSDSDTSRALEKYQRALIQVFPAFNDTLVTADPKIEDVSIDFQCYAAASKKAMLLASFGKNRGQTAHCFDLAFESASKLRSTYGTDEAKLELQASCQDVRQEAVRNLWALAAQDTPEKQALLARLFRLIEMTRANALLDALNRQDALNLTGLPDSILKKETFMRVALAEMSQKEQLNQPFEEKAKIRQDITALQQKYHFLLQKIRQEYPVFAQRFNPGNTSAEMLQIQSRLSSASCILSWFDTGTSYLCIAMSRKGYDGWEVPKDSTLLQQLGVFSGMIADKSALEQHRDVWFGVSNNLYQRLIPEKIAATFQQWMVIPDAALCFLPFDALLTEAYSGNFAHAPYLLHQKTIQYLWAARLLLQPEVTTGNRQLLWMAPFVTHGARQLAPLPYAAREIPGDFNTTNWHDEMASADTFRQYCPNYRFIHLSTHAQAGEEPRLEFADRALSLPELYALWIPADLVCLSACETSGGALAGGEGVLSLARGFAYAGARRLVAGWWSVNDRSTAAFFDQFYSFAADYPVEIAVNRAKRQMLANSQEPDARKSPYHWAAFGLYGHTGMLYFKETSSWVGPGILALALVGFLLFILFRKEAVLHTSSDFGHQSHL
jgi:CHAT domain-containing protein